MRRWGWFSLGAWLFVSIASDVQAQVRIRRGDTALEMFVGISGQDLDDLNDVIRDDERTFRNAGIPADFETFDAAPQIGIGITHGVESTVALGAEFTHQWSSVENRYFDAGESYSDEIDLRMTEISGVIEVRIRESPGLSFGGSMGAGFGDLEEDVRFRDFQDPSNNVDALGEFDGSGLVVGGFVNYRIVAGRTAHILVRGGYSYRNLGEFDGASTTWQNGSPQTLFGPATDSFGRPIDFDFSGFYLRIGVGFGLGSAPRSRGRFR